MVARALVAGGVIAVVGGRLVTAMSSALPARLNR
jgi:hypothetical protein